MCCPSRGALSNCYKEVMTLLPLLPFFYFKKLFYFKLGYLVISLGDNMIKAHMQNYRAQHFLPLQIEIKNVFFKKRKEIISSHSNSSKNVSEHRGFSKYPMGFTLLYLSWRWRPCAIIPGSLSSGFSLLIGIFPSLWKQRVQK